MSAKLLKSHKTFEGLTQFWQHASSSTSTDMKFSTFIPTGKVKGCIVWLSGLTCTDENFITKAGAQKRLAENNIMVICPDTSPRGLNLPHEHDADDFGSGASFYLDATTEGYKNHYRMSKYITEDLFDLIQTQFKIGANKISICGHSMGGHGALTLGLRFPEKFQAVSAFAPITNPVQAPWGQKAFKGYLGDSMDQWKLYDATELVTAGKRHPQPLLIDQGSSDPFLDKQLLPQHLVDACKNADQPIIYNLREGYDHSYYFISTFIDAHIDFHAERL